mmetsp:Transcript_5690/g.17364  ORF Transcript_5690/g.17364 Transcript_5690/m.17364 type:complete len:237 (-) Transcript_5690:367-1077(-)
MRRTTHTTHRPSASCCASHVARRLFCRQQNLPPIPLTETRQPAALRGTQPARQQHGQPPAVFLQARGNLCRAKAACLIAGARPDILDTHENRLPIDRQRCRSWQQSCNLAAILQHGSRPHSGRQQSACPGASQLLRQVRQREHAQRWAITACVHAVNCPACRPPCMHVVNCPGIHALCLACMHAATVPPVDRPFGQLAATPAARSWGAGRRGPGAVTCPVRQPPFSPGTLPMPRRR